MFKISLKINFKNSIAISWYDLLGHNLSTDKVANSQWNHFWKLIFFQHDVMFKIFGIKPTPWHPCVDGLFHTETMLKILHTIYILHRIQTMYWKHVHMYAVCRSQLFQSDVASPIPYIDITRIDFHSRLM